MSNKQGSISNITPGQILVRELDDCMTFRSGYEYTQLIFLSLGQNTSSYRDFEYGDMEEVIHSNAVDIFTGDFTDWGIHMFVTVHDFMVWVNNIKFLLKANPLLVEKIKSDTEDEFSLNGFSKIKGMQAVNAIIRHATLIVNGVESGEFIFPDSVRKSAKYIIKSTRVAESSDIRNRIVKLEIKLHDLEDGSDEETKLQEEITKLEDRLSEINNGDISDEDVDAYINDVLIESIKQIAAVEPFDIISMTEAEKRDREAYKARKEKEMAEKLAAEQSYCEDDKDCDNDEYDEDCNCDDDGCTCCSGACDGDCGCCNNTDECDNDCPTEAADRLD